MRIKPTNMARIHNDVASALQKKGFAFSNLLKPLRRNTRKDPSIPKEITLYQEEPEEESDLTTMTYYNENQVCPIFFMHDTDGEMVYRVYTQDMKDFVVLRGREELGQFCTGLFEYDPKWRFNVVSSLPQAVWKHKTFDRI